MKQWDLRGNVNIDQLFSSFQLAVLKKERYTSEEINGYEAIKKYKTAIQAQRKKSSWFFLISLPGSIHSKNAIQAQRKELFNSSD